MGVDLNVLATSFRDHRGEFLPAATLRFERNPALFARLARTQRRALCVPPAGPSASIRTTA